MAINQIYNIAFGERTTLKELWQYIQNAADVKLAATYGPNRIGDIPHSLADISKANKLSTYDPKYDVKNGLKLAFEWYKSKLKSEILN